MKTGVLFLKKTTSRQILLLLFTFLWTPSFSQQLLFLKVIPVDKDTVFLNRHHIHFEKSFPDSIALIGALRKQLDNFHKRGFLAASFDTIQQKDSLFTAHLFVGRQFQWAKLSKGNVDDNLLKTAGFLEEWYQMNVFSYAQIANLMENILSVAENNGYPFATIKIDSITFSGEKISGRLSLKKNKYITFEGIDIQGDIKLSKKYLENYLGIKSGMPYDKRLVLSIKKRIRELPFLKEKKNAVITFKHNKATVVLFPERKKASRFDFLVGVLPNNTQTKKLLITGNFLLEIQNQFGHGERFFAEFDRIHIGTQKLNFQFSYPFVLDLPFGIDAKLDLFKKDSTYFNTDLTGGLQYVYRGNNSLKVFWQRTATRLLHIDKQQINANRLPANLDVTNTGIGLAWSHAHLDYRLNPRKGWSVLAEGSAGIRTIPKNEAILKLKKDFYDTLNISGYLYKFGGEVATFIPVFARSTVSGKVHFGYLLTKEKVFENEQFRIGGNRLLRGFDEESILAKQFAVLTLEYRFLLSRNSYMYVFGDYGFVKNDSFDQPFGFGAGITFETKAGIFGVSYAFGRQLDNPVEFDKGKIHFGFVSLF